MTFTFSQDNPYLTNSDAKKLKDKFKITEAARAARSTTPMSESGLEFESKESLVGTPTLYDKYFANGLAKNSVTGNTTPDGVAYSNWDRSTSFDNPEEIGTPKLISDTQTNMGRDRSAFDRDAKVIPDPEKDPPSIWDDVTIKDYIKGGLGIGKLGLGLAQFIEDRGLAKKQKSLLDQQIAQNKQAMANRENMIAGLKGKSNV